MASRPNITDATAAHLYLAGSHTPGAYALAINTAASAALTLPEGTYVAWMAARTATTSIFCKIGGAVAAVPADGTVDAGVWGFPGDETTRFVIKAGDTKTLNVLPSTGTGTLYVVGI